MVIVYIIIGIILGIGLSIIFKDKLTANNTNKTNKIDSVKSYLEVEISKFKNEITENNNEIDNLNMQLKRLRKKVEEEKSKNEDSSDTIESYKSKNHLLAQEIEKMKLELKEYEMLYNARKDELEFLRQQLDK
jgi:peptidoglycan hydrolase CwlO-like protein